jgi:hypothetical protein
MSSSGTWCCVDRASTDVSTERIASIFTVEKSVSGNQRQQMVADHQLLTLAPRSLIFLP